MLALRYFYFCDRLAADRNISADQFGPYIPAGDALNGACCHGDYLRSLFCRGRGYADPRLCVAIYAVLIQGELPMAIYRRNLRLHVSYGVLLCAILMKTGTISKHLQRHN